MVRARDDWVRLARPGFQVELSYPPVTPSGHRVERTDERVVGHPIAGDFERAHLTSPGSSELYLEVARFPGRSPQDEYREHHPHLAQRFGDDAITELTETAFRGRAAWEYSFRWDGGERAVLLVEVSGDTYRVIYDPRSALNERVLETLTVTG